MVAEEYVFVFGVDTHAASHAFAVITGRRPLWSHRPSSPRWRDSRSRDNSCEYLRDAYRNDPRSRWTLCRTRDYADEVTGSVAGRVSGLLRSA
jgi:hypothetical protein